MRFRLLIGVGIIISILMGLFIDDLQSPRAQAGAIQKIESTLLNQLSTLDQVDMIIRFSEQADLSPAYGLSWQERGEYVVDILTDTAHKSQEAAKAALDAQGMKYQTFIAGNELYVWGGNLDTTNVLASLPEVEYLRSTRIYSIDPIPLEIIPFSNLNWAGDWLAQNRTTSVGNTPSAVTWGISYTKANQFWTQLGDQGQGIVVANIDTGVQYDHPALDQAYKCMADPSNPACWYDPSNICGGSPCDNNGHGTHTMGTMVGDDDLTLPYQVGMAPEAKWITCKGCESTQCSDYALNTCADWILQPGGSTANRPHIVNNSWGGESGDTWYLSKVTAWRAAGIFPAFSAGNIGPDCSTIGSPGDYQESFASAAHGSDGTIANFSSRGPSTYGHEPFTKPNISAPGVNICSTLPTNTWSCAYSGTSMASPHSAGAVALLWSCNPDLIGQVDATFQILQETAGAAPSGSCGAPPDGDGNYTYGYGYLDVLQAGIYSCGGIDLGSLQGFVKDADSGDPIEGASVMASPLLLGEDSVDATTDPSGYYTMSLPVGSYDVTTSKIGYLAETISGVDIVFNTNTRQDFSLEWIGTWVAGPEDPTDFTRYDCVWFDDGTGGSIYNQKVYCPGGRTGQSSDLPDVWRYDPLVETFQDTGHKLDEGLSNYAALVLQDQEGWATYIISGYDIDSLSVFDDVQRYDPASGEIKELTDDPSPIKVGGMAATPGGCAVANNKIYCFGGWLSTVSPYFSNQTWEYDPDRPAGSRWQEITSADLSLARGYIQVAVQGNVIYALGGVAGYSAGDLIPTAVVEALDVNNLVEGWQVLASMPVATGEGRGFGFDADTQVTVEQTWEGKLYVVGGGDWPAETSEVMEYDIATDTWDQTYPNLLSSRRDHAGVFIPLCTEDPLDGLPGMWVFGGRQGSDDPPYLEPEYYPLPCQESPPPFILEKTVGTAANMCADSNRLEILTDTLVTYCFTLINNSEITLTLHDLEDTHLGTVLDGTLYELAPGSSTYVTDSITVTSTTINLATWRVYNEGGPIFQASDSAIVIVPGSYFVVNLPTIYKQY